MLTLKRDIHSLIKPSRIYGKAGEKVEIIKWFGKLCIVEGDSGVRFTVSCDDIKGFENL